MNISNGVSLYPLSHLLKLVIITKYSKDNAVSKRPPPLDTIVFGAFCILLLIAVIKLIAKIIDMIPFL